MSASINAANHGLRGNDSVTILSGSMNITAKNDGIQTNNTEDASLGWVLIENGIITVIAGDDGIHADGNLAVNAGTIKVTEAYEGLEAANIVINGGIIDLVTSDNALNAAGGVDKSGGTGTFGKDIFSAGNAYDITINGGNITFMAGGDGIDSNGTLNINGGTIVAVINSSADNGALDSDGTTTFTGGTIIYGGTGTGSTPGNNSTQSYLFVNSGITTGKEILVKKDGQTLITFTPATNCQYLALSSPDIKSGESYDVYSGGSLISTVTAGTGGSGMGAGGPRGMSAPGGKDAFGGTGGPGGMKGSSGAGGPGRMNGSGRVAAPGE